MRSDKMPTRRGGEASSNTAVCAAKTVKKTACGRWRLILAHNDTQKNKIAKKKQQHFVRNESREREDEQRSEKAEAEKKPLVPWAIEDDCGPRRRVPSGHVCGVCRGRECLFVRVASTGTSSERARVERCVTRVDSGSFERPAWWRESAGGRANGCAPASGLSRLHIRFMARYSR